MCRTSGHCRSSLLLAIVLMMARCASADPIAVKSYNMNVPLTHCALFSGELNMVVEWAVSFQPKNLLEVRYTTQSSRGFVGIGFSNSDKNQVVQGYPIEYVPCAKALYDNYSPYDIDGNTYPNYPEVPAALSNENTSHTWVYALRNLSNAAVHTLQSGGSVSSNVTILWAYLQSSLYSGSCYMGSIAEVTEKATFRLPISGTAYQKNTDGTCKKYSGPITRHRGTPPLKPAPAPLLDGEMHQNTRSTIMFMGANLMLETGKLNPKFAPPPAGFVLIGDNDLGVCQSSTAVIRVHWNGFSDRLGGVQKYLITAGTPSLPSIFVDRFDAGTNLAQQITLAQPMPPNSTLVVTVTAINFAGLRTVVTAKRVRVLNDGKPVFGKIFDGTQAEAKTGLKKFQNSISTLAATWTGWLPDEHSTRNYNSGLFTDIGYSYAVGEDGLTDTSVLGWQSVPAFTFEKTVTGLTLQHGKKYSVSIMSTNCAGAVTKQRSPGVTVDTVAPFPGRVNFGNSSQKHFANIRRSGVVQATWFGFFDSLSGIVKYYWGMGPAKKPLNALTSAGFIMPWTDVGGKTSARNGTVAALPKQHLLTVGKKIYVYVRAVDAAGNFVVVSSNATTITN